MGVLKFGNLKSKIWPNHFKMDNNQIMKKMGVIKKSITVECVGSSCRNSVE
jgi:hypothetical protein